MRGGTNEVSLNGKKLSDILSNLNNKANADLSNVTYPTKTLGSTTTGAGDRVIESYISSDGKTWYRKWASGWKECGMITTGVTVTLPITFSNTNYNTVFSLRAWATWDTIGVGHLKAEPQSENTVKFEVGDQYTKSLYCCGY